MTKDKKIEEKEYLEYFLTSNEGIKWQNDNKIISYHEAESPDFIFTTKDNQKIGIEITNFFVKSLHGQALRHLMTIGNQLCKYAKKEYGLNISILIDKWDKRKWQARTRQEILDAIYNPGFWDIYDKKAIKTAIIQIIDNNIEKLKQWPRLVQSSILVQDEYFNISISGFENIGGKFDCTVSNECISKEDPLDELQAEIDKKNKKISSYLKHCNKCFLLICLPDVSQGNYCHFTNKLIKQVFSSKFDNIYLCKYNTIFTF